MATRNQSNDQSFSQFYLRVLRDNIGSLPYYSPEIARGSHYTGPEVDIWCLGVVLYRMTVGRDPFVGATKREVKHQIIQQGFYPPAWLSPSLRNTLRTLLVHDGSLRRSLAILENDPWLHEDSSKEPPFLSEDRSMTETSRLSGTTLVRQSSGNTKRQSHTDSYYYGKSRSLFGSRSVLGDTLNAGVWQIDKRQPRFRKNRIRITPCPGAQHDLLFQKDADLSLLQFLMPILRSCHVSYYLHSTSRILCGTSFVREAEGFNQASLMLQKLVHQVGAAMTGGSIHEAADQCLMPRCGVFSIDIVKAKGEHGGHLLIIKRLLGSSLTVPYFKRQFLYNATLRDTLLPSSPSFPV